MVASKPAITVVISTYNWSSALRCAIRSVLLQTRQDFEVLVVGDGCTDDSEAVVAAFNDKRIRWHNLDRNYGSQWAPNNHGNEHAQADWIAYLGHDDIWYPTHLEAILRAADQHAAEIVTSTMILYWPEPTRGRSIAGIFAAGAFQRGDFVPPSALAHARSLYGSVVRWRDPAETAAPVDVEFLDTLAAASRRFAPTNELTCFKFNAAWRRDAYRIRSVDEQQRMLARIESGTDFRQRELFDVVQAAVSGKFSAIVAPPVAGVKAGSYAAANRRDKGLDRRFDPRELRRIETTVLFGMENQTMPFEWHQLETNDQGTFRWSGPSPIATIDLPVKVDRDLRIRIHVPMVLNAAMIEKIKLSVHGNPLDLRIHHNNAGYIVETAVRKSSVDPDRDFGITIDTGSVARAKDLGLGPDVRWLGLAVSRIEIEPIDVGQS